MPTLQFKGKNIIWNHHLSIPYHTLEEVLKLDFQVDKGAGNPIIKDNNLFYPTKRMLTVQKKGII
jgi:adenine-specific DNA-methyltransferase